MDKIQKPLTLRERNTKALEKVTYNSPEMKMLKEKFKKLYGIDLFTEAGAKKFPVMDPSFSWNTLKNKLEMREADASSSFVQFLRVGLQTITNGAYLNHQTTFEDWVRVTPSKHAEEPYAPNHGVSFPREVSEQQLYPEVGAAALDLKIRNKKFGAMYVVSKELLADDQSGSFLEQASKLGEYMKLLSEVLCYGKLASVSGMKYIDFEIPVSETKPSYEASYPWSQAFRGGGKNRPASFTAPNQTTLQAAKVALMNQKNLQGIKMNVTGNRIIAGPARELEIATILNSTFFPQVASATPGAVGGPFSVNVLKGFAALTVSPYVFKNDGTVNGDSTAWYLCDDTKPFFVLQARETATVEQEATNAGESFNRDLYRFKSTSRMNADFIDPRFIFQGSDGSI